MKNIGVSEILQSNFHHDTEDLMRNTEANFIEGLANPLHDTNGGYSKVMAFGFRGTLELNLSDCRPVYWEKR